MKSLLFLVISLYISTLYASEEKVLYSQLLVFKEFHDPGWLVSVDDQEYEFKYEGFTFENISTWKRGRKLLLTYSFDKGILIHDSKSGTVAHIYHLPTHPIDIVLEQCLDERTTTMGMASCYDDASGNWDREMNRAYQVLKSTNSSEVFEAIQKMQRAWIKYRDNRVVVIRNRYTRDEGTITIIENSARVLQPIRKQALFLGSLIKYQ